MVKDSPGIIIHTSYEKSFTKHLCTSKVTLVETWRTTPQDTSFTVFA